jgi:nitrite reductase (NADH) large subunit
MSPNASVRHVVIVGNGIAGIAAAGQVRRLHPRCGIHLVGIRHPRRYEGAVLSDVAPGYEEATRQGLLPDQWFAEQRITSHLRLRAQAVDALRHEVLLDSGERLDYDRLILATGAAPGRHDIEGLPLEGAHVICQPSNVEEILAGSEMGRRRVVVIGAGALGVQVAARLGGTGATVTLVDREDFPLPHLQDRRVGQLVERHLASLGVDVRMGTAVRHAYGDNRIVAIGLREQERLPCDVLLICPGHHPNAELADAAGLRVGTGIVVDDTMRTTHPHVFACGAAAEYRGRCTMDWRTAIDQARIAAEQAIVRKPSGRHRLTTGFSASELDLPGMRVTSVGRTRPTATDRVLVLEQPYRRQYRKLILTGGGILAGGICVNDPDAFAVLESALSDRSNVQADVTELRSGDLTALESVAESPSRRVRRKIGIPVPQPRESQEQEASMVDVERIWRIRTSADGDLEIRLGPGNAGERQVVLQHTGGDGDGLRALNLGAARALAETLLEACEVASALTQDVASPR